MHQSCAAITRRDVSVNAVAKEPDESATKAPPLFDTEPQTVIDQRRQVGAELQSAQEDHTMVFPYVDSSAVAQTAITLADLLYGGEQDMITIDMSQLTDEETVQTKLFGSTQGFVGYSEGERMTEAFLRKPYSVDLLDKFEKAASGIQLQFYQIFDAGRGHESEGNDIDFRHTIILTTMNAGSSFIRNLCLNPETRPVPKSFVEAFVPELLKSSFEPHCSAALRLSFTNHWPKTS